MSNSQIVWTENTAWTDEMLSVRWYERAVQKWPKPSAIRGREIEESRFQVKAGHFNMLKSAIYVMKWDGDWVLLWITLHDTP